MLSSRFSRQSVGLLILVTLIWGINWPVMKYAINQYPPLSFRILSMLGGVVCMWVVARAKGIDMRIPPHMRRRVLGLALVNMAGWHIFCVLAVAELTSGRAAILGYTMPVWAVISSRLLGDPVPKRNWLGVVLAMAGVGLLLSGEWGSLVSRPVGIAYMLMAAMCWGAGTALIRKYPTGLSPLAATHAMMWITILCMTAAASVLEWQGGAARWPQGFSQWWPIVYNAILVIGIAHVVWIGMAASLPPAASSVSIMLIPVLGVFAGMAWLGEQPHWQDFAALGFILVAMAVVLPRRG